MELVDARFVLVLCSLFLFSLSLSLSICFSASQPFVCAVVVMFWGCMLAPTPRRSLLPPFPFPSPVPSLSLSLCFIAPFSRETPALVKLSGPFSVSNASPYPGNKDKGGEPSPVTQKRTAGQTLPPLG